MNTIRVKFHGEGKTYNFSSKNEYPLDTQVVVLNKDGSKEKAVVVDCYEDNIEHDGKVLHRWSKNMYSKIKKRAMNQEFSFTQQAFQKYQKQVAGNFLETIDQANKKINRNIILGTKKVYLNDYGIVNTWYGKLKISIDLETNKVVDVKNFCTGDRKWKKDTELYEKLNEAFGIKGDNAYSW